MLFLIFSFSCQSFTSLVVFLSFTCIIFVYNIPHKKSTQTVFKEQTITMPTKQLRVKRELKKEIKKKRGQSTNNCFIKLAQYNFCKLDYHWIKNIKTRMLYNQLSRWMLNWNSLISTWMGFPVFFFTLCEIDTFQLNSQRKKFCKINKSIFLHACLLMRIMTLNMDWTLKKWRNVLVIGM